MIDFFCVHLLVSVFCLRTDSGMSSEDLQKMIQRVDLDGNGELDFEEFVTMMAGSLASQFDKQEVLNAFKTFELANNPGHIDIPNLIDTLDLLYVVTPYEKFGREIKKQNNTDGNDAGGYGGNDDNDDTDDNNMEDMEPIYRHEIPNLVSTIGQNRYGIASIEEFVHSVI